MTYLNQKSVMITLKVLDFHCRNYKSLIVQMKLCGINNGTRINLAVRLTNHVAELTSHGQGHFRGRGR